MYEKEPLLEIRPRFVYWPAFVSRMPVTFFMTLWGGGFFGGLSLFVIKSLEIPGFKFMSLVPSWFPFAFFGTVFFLGIQFWSLDLERSACEKTRYLFYPDEIVYYEGFWNIEEKSVSYKNILEVSHTKGVLQQKYGLGTIKLTTAASYGQKDNGIRLKNIPDSDNVYRFVKDHLNKIKEESLV